MFYRKNRYRMFCAGIFISLIASFAASGTASAQPSRSVTGSVSDVDGKPIAGASITVVATPMPAKPSATTGADGSFRVAKAARKALTIRVSAEGYRSSDISFAAGRTPATLRVVLAKNAAPAAAKTRIVSGLVANEDGSPVAGAMVKLQGTNTTTATDANGLFVLPAVPTGKIALEITAKDHAGQVASISGNQSVIKLIMESTAPIPTRTVSGRLLDQDGEPVIGAAITVLGSEVLAISDENGSYTLEGAPVGDLVLSAEAVGYGNKSIPAPANVATVDFSLSIAVGGEDDEAGGPDGGSQTIVIRGRTPIIMKSNASDSATVIGSKDITKVSADTLEGALKGKISGANLQSNSGAPGGGSQIRMRGVSTINGGSSPLIIVDGVVFSNESIASGLSNLSLSGGARQDNATNRLADINPNDIESVEVLKGAAAGALYGSKASNGVLVITTKRGKQGKAKVNLTQRFGFAQLSNKLGSRTFKSAEEVMDTFGSQTVVDMYNAANGKTYDHEEQLSQSSLARETIASISGGGKDSRYFASILARDQPGVFKGTFYEKQTGKVSVGYDFGDRLSVDVSGTFTHSNVDRGITGNDNSGTSYALALGNTPNFFDLSKMPNGAFPDNPFNPSNPLQTAELFDANEEVFRFTGSFNAGLRIFSNSEHTVSGKSTFGVDRFQQQGNVVSPPELQFEGDDGLPGTVIDVDTGNLNYNADVGATWEFTPTSGKFRSVMTGGFTHEVVDQVNVMIFGQNLVAGQPNVDSATVVNTNETRLRTIDQGFYLQEEVALLDDKLTLSAGALAERSSLNGDTSKYFFFPKVGASYALPVPEKFLEDVRLRVRYGETGNRPNYGQKFTRLLANNTIDGNPALVVSAFSGDAEIEPERQREIEYGIDITSKNQRAVLELTAYQKFISNMLLQRELPTSTGFSRQFVNGGSMRNRGVEATLTVLPVTNEDVEWSSRATFSLNRSRVTSLPDGVEPFTAPVGFGAILGQYIIEPGKSATQLQVLAGEEGIIDYGNGEPDFIIGWSNDVTVQDFSFGMLWHYQHGSKIANLTRLLSDFSGLSKDFVDGKTDTELGAGEKRLDAFLNDDGRPYIEDGTFLKMREISVNYNLPKPIVEKLSLDSLSLNLSARNLVTLTNYTGADPEVSNFGSQAIGRNIDVGSYAPSRSFWFSISAGL